MRDATFMGLMRLLPKSALSSTVGHLTRMKAPAAVHRAAMRAFVRRYRVDLGEADRELKGYRNFAEFFTRRLKPGLRTVDSSETSIVSPVDGVVSQVGYARASEGIQAKGICYPLEELLGD